MSLEGLSEKKKKHFILIHSEFNKTEYRSEGFEGEGEADEAREQRGQETGC